MKTVNEILKMVNENLENSYITAEEWLFKKHGMKFEDNKLNIFNSLVFTAYNLLENKEPKTDFRTDKNNDVYKIYVFNEIEYPILQYCLNKLIAFKNIKIK